MMVMNMVSRCWCSPDNDGQLAPFCLQLLFCHMDGHDDDHGDDGDDVDGDDDGDHRDGNSFVR